MFDGNRCVKVEPSGPRVASGFWLSLAGLFYVHIGYPAMLALLVKRSRRATHGPTPDRRSALPCGVSVSFIISAYDEREVIEEKVRNTLALEPAPSEILVVADGSTDGTEVVVAGIDDPRIRVLHEAERKGKSAAINRGAEHALGDILVLSDANNLYATDALHHLLSPFEAAAVGGVTGQRAVRGAGGLASGEGFYGRYERKIRELESDLGACTAASGEIMALRKELFSPIPASVSTDDLYLAMSVLGAGREFIFAPKARCFENAPDSDGAEFERRSRFSAARLWLLVRPGFVTQGGRRVAWQFVSHKAGRLTIPFCFMGALTGAVRATRQSGRRRGLLALGAPWGAIALCGQLAGWSLGLIARFAPGMLPRRLRDAGTAIWFLLLGNLAIVNGWWRFVRGRREVVWRRVGRATPD